MNVIDQIIAKRPNLQRICTHHGIVLKLFGSCLNRTESPTSNIDFLAVFDQSTYYRHKIFEVQEALEALFNRKVILIDAIRIPEGFQPTDPVNMMELKADQHYEITPKTSQLYFVVLQSIIKHHDIEKFEASPLVDHRGLHAYLARRINWWFRKLLYLYDNDLRAQKSLREVLPLCSKLQDKHYQASTDEITRFKELFPLVKEFVNDRCPPEDEELTQFAQEWVGIRSFDPYEEMD